MHRGFRATVLALPVLVWSAPSVGQQAPTGDDLADLVESTQPREFEDYSAFLDYLVDEGRVQGVEDARDAMDSESGPDSEQLNLLARLLGVFNRSQHESEALELLRGLVAIETYASPDYPDQYDNPAFIEFGEKIADVAEEFGMDYRNVDGRIFEVTLDGPSEDVFGILTHSDVVPVQSRSWAVEEGGEVNPFEMRVIGNRIYGRGTIDDKGSIATALYAMRSVKNSGLPLDRDIRLMIETTEETSGDGMAYYLENESVPDYNIVLDSDYPAVTAEKGYGTITARFPVIDAGSSSATITQIVGSSAANQIPERATATIQTDDAEGLSADLTQAATSLVEELGGDFSVEMQPDDGKLELIINGTSAHASEPENGVNPVPRLAAFLLNSEVDLADNHYWQALNYIDQAYGMDYLGEKLGVGYADDFMGPLTLSPTYFEEDGDSLIMAVNVRAPRKPDSEAADVQAQISEALENWKSDNDAAASFDVEVTDWIVRDTSGNWLQTLLAIYGDTTGNPSDPISSAGSTTAKLLPNAVNFGPNLPTDKYMGHTENEFKRLDVMGYDLQMFTEMMVRISNLESLE